MEGKRPNAQDARAAIVTLLEYIGENPGRDGLKGTPDRILKAYGELLGGYKADPEEILRKSFQVGAYDEMILSRDIPFTSFCEHHWLPFFGVAHVAYMPLGDRVVGLSKLSRVVDAYAHRLQIQERMTRDIAQAIEFVLAPRGVAVVVEAEHSCMSSRGVRKVGSQMVTSEMRGIFREDHAVRAEFFSILRAPRRQR